MFFVAKVKGKNLYLNERSSGMQGEKVSFHFISKTPMLFDGSSELRETIRFYQAGFGKLINEIDDSTIDDLIVQQCKLTLK